jgi:hypothetical protein
LTSAVRATKQFDENDAVSSAIAAASGRSPNVWMLRSQTRLVSIRRDADAPREGDVERLRRRSPRGEQGLHVLRQPEVVVVENREILRLDLGEPGVQRLRARTVGNGELDEPLDTARDVVRDRR